MNIQEAVDRVAHTGQTEVVLQTRARHGEPAEEMVVEPTGMVLVLAADMVRGVLHASRVQPARPHWTLQVYTPPRALPFFTWAVLAVMWHLAPEGTPTGTAEEIARVRCRVCGRLGLLALLCWCARVVCVVLCVWCPGTLGSCSPVLRCVAVCVVSGVRCCVCGVLGLPAPVHRCVRPTCGVVWAVSRAAWLLFTGVLVRCVVWCVRCPGPLGSCSPLCPRGVCCVACSVSWAPWLPFTGVLCACSVCCVVCAVSWAT